MSRIFGYWRHSTEPSVTSTGSVQGCFSVWESGPGDLGGRVRIGGTLGNPRRQPSTSRISGNCLVRVRGARATVSKCEGSPESPRNECPKSPWPAEKERTRSFGDRESPSQFCGMQAISADFAHRKRAWCVCGQMPKSSWRLREQVLRV